MRTIVLRMVDQQKYCYVCTLVLCIDRSTKGMLCVYNCLAYGRSTKGLLCVYSYFVHRQIDKRNVMCVH